MTVAPGTDSEGGTGGTLAAPASALSPKALLSSSSQYGENRSPAVPGTLGFPPRRGRRKKPRPLAPDPLENYASSHSKAHQDGDEGAGREKQCQGGAS